MFVLHSIGVWENPSQNPQCASCAKIPIDDVNCMAHTLAGGVNIVGTCTFKVPREYVYCCKH